MCACKPSRRRTRNLIDLPMLTSGLTVSGFCRPEHVEEQDDEKSESEPPEQCYSSPPPLGSCSRTIVDISMKDAIGQAGEKPKQQNDQSEVSFSNPPHITAEPMTGSSSVMGFESGVVHLEEYVGEKDSALFEQVYIGTSSGLAWSTTSGLGITTDLEEFAAEDALQKVLAEKTLKEFKPSDQQSEEDSRFSAVPSSSVLGLGGREDQDSILLDLLHTRASSGHARQATSAFGIRTDLEEFEAEIAEQKHEELKPLEQRHDEVLNFSESSLKQFESLDQQHDEVLGCTGFPSSSVVRFGTRKLEGDVRDRPFPDEVYISANSNPSFGFQTKDKGKRVVDAGEFELFSKQEKNRISTVARRADVGFRGKLKRIKPDEDSPSCMEIKAISLPEELVEKILSMIPFPAILKTCVLNKSWNGNFSTRPEALVFQNQVKAISCRWKHYCPIILNIEKEWLVGYDREYNRWQNMPLSFEREGLKNWFSTQKLRGAGSLMCGVFNRNNIFVTNIVTRMWKWLPPRPGMAYPKEIHLLPIGSDSYQVLVITKNERDPTEVSCQLYDSRMESWTIKQSTVSTALFNSSSAYLDGVLYIMEYDPDDFRDIMKMLSYNVKDGVWTHIHHPFGSMLHEIETYELLVCQNHVMVVLRLHPTWWTTYKSHKIVRNTLIVYKLDPISLEIREVARGPPEPMSAACTLFASDNDSIYFGNPQVVGSSVIELNLQSKEWSCLPPPTCVDGSFKNKWVTFPFQPGMNPFVSV